MKVSVTARDSLNTGGRLRLAELIGRRAVQRLNADIEDELQQLRASHSAADAETRRDVLERVVRRIWGATQ